MTKEGKYIYGIIPRRSLSTAQLIVPGQINSKNLAERKVERQTGGSTACEEIHIISYRDISAVVENLRIVDYIHMPKEDLALRLLRHQKVIEEVMTGDTVIPVRLGTFALDEDEIGDILSKGYKIIKNIFEKIINKIEIDVVCTWSDFTAAIKETSEAEEIKELKERLLKNSKGITFDDQMRVGVMLKDALDQTREGYAVKIENALKEFCDDFRRHELMNDKMVLNAAFLIDRLKQKEFYAKVEDLNAKFEEKLNFRCVGPLPPYSFFTLEIKKIQFNEVDWARKKLGIINDPVAKDEIKKAFHRQVFIFHPDKNPDKPGIEKEYDEITRSYKILLDYAQACEQIGQESLIFNEDEFKKNAVLVKVRE